MNKIQAVLSSAYCQSKVLSNTQAKNILVYVTNTVQLNIV